MLLVASDRKPQHRKIPKMILQGSSPLCSSWLCLSGYECLSFSLQLVPERLLQFRASHAGTQALVAKNCSIQPEMIFRTSSNQYSRVWTSGKKLQLYWHGPAEYHECFQGCLPKRKVALPTELAHSSLASTGSHDSIPKASF